MNKSVVFIGNYTDDETYKLITENNIRDLSQAARLFQKRLINNLRLHVSSFLAISVLPSDGEIDLPQVIYDTNVDVKVIPLVNGSFSSIIETMRKVVSITSYNNCDEKIVLMYAVNPIVLIPLLAQKKKHKLTLATICPELPQFRRYRTDIRSSTKRLIFSIFNRTFDKYILFSDAMRAYIPKGKSYMVLEGFAPDQIQEPSIREKNIALYAGGLAKDNGIEMMIEAAHKSKLIDEMWICGIGECLEYVINNTDDKVKYLGMLNNSEVLLYEKQAKVLLNARDPNNELTRFSFPSKILEYMSAGGIVISSKLLGIPREYWEHIFILDDYTSDDLASKMDKVFQMSNEEFIQTTTNATSFVKEKSANQRCNEIVQFLNE